MSSSVKVVLGCGSIGDKSDPWAKYSNAEAAQEFLNIFRKHGYVDLDTARGYSPHAPGTSEPIMGQTDARAWAAIDTKFGGPPGSGTVEAVQNSIKASLTALQMERVNILWIHMPDRSTPFLETCRAVNQAHKAGSFAEFGLSNFKPDEVQSVLDICKTNGYVMPTAYQGHFNPITRGTEADLFPILRKNGMKFYAFSPSAGGIFSDKIHPGYDKEGGRWDSKTFVGTFYKQMYFKADIFEAVKTVVDEAKKAGITGHAACLRWVMHHSILRGEAGDGMIIGASSLQQLEENCRICKDGPLPQGLVKVLDNVWAHAKEAAPSPYVG